MITTPIFLIPRSDRVTHKECDLIVDFIESLSSLVLTNSVDCNCMFVPNNFDKGLYKDQTKSKDRHTNKFA